MLDIHCHSLPSTGSILRIGLPSILRAVLDIISLPLILRVHQAGSGWFSASSSRCLRVIRVITAIVGVCIRILRVTSRGVLAKFKGPDVNALIRHRNRLPSLMPFRELDFRLLLPRFDDGALRRAAMYLKNGFSFGRLLRELKKALFH